MAITSNVYSSEGCRPIRAAVPKRSGRRYSAPWDPYGGTNSIFAFCWGRTCKAKRGSGEGGEVKRGEARRGVADSVIAYWYSRDHHGRPPPPPPPPTTTMANSVNAAKPYHKKRGLSTHVYGHLARLDEQVRRWRLHEDALRARPNALRVLVRPEELDADDPR